jgi:hypothetical protein
MPVNPGRHHVQAGVELRAANRTHSTAANDTSSKLKRIQEQTIDFFEERGIL